MRIDEAFKRITAGEVEPDQVVKGDRFSISAYSADKVGLPHIRVTDKVSGLIIGTFTPGTDKSFNMFQAWIAARHSRSAESTLQIAQDAIEKGVDAGAKMQQTVEAYGHESVRDMSYIGVSFENIPIDLAAKLFYATRIHSGQEKSTRYQRKFGLRSLVPLDAALPEETSAEVIEETSEAYRIIGDVAMELYAKYKELIVDKLGRIFIPSNREEHLAVELRALDCVSFFLPQAVETGMVLFTTIQHWQRLIAHLKGSEIRRDVLLGEQLEYLLNPPEEVAQQLNYIPEAGTLLKHTKPFTSFHNTFREVVAYLRENNIIATTKREIIGVHSQRVVRMPHRNKEDIIIRSLVFQFLSEVFPSIEYKDVIKIFNKITLIKRRGIISLLTKGYDRFKPLDEIMAVTAMQSTVETSMAVVRDLNRHRAQARYIRIPIFQGRALTYEMLQGEIAKGFILPVHMTHLREMKEIKEGMIKDLEDYYAQVEAFALWLFEKHGNTIDYSFVHALLPMAHRTQLTMHGDPKTWFYTIAQRTAVGGRIDYRILVEQMAENLARDQTFPRDFFPINRVDPQSRDQFYGRS